MPVHTVANIKIKIASAEHFSLQLSPTPRLPLIKKIRQSCKGLAGEKSPAEVRQWTWKKKIIASWKSPIPLSLFQWSIPKSDRWPSPRIPRHIREYFFICDYNDYSRKWKGTLFICDLFKNQKEKYYYTRMCLLFWRKIIKWEFHRKWKLSTSPISVGKWKKLTPPQHKKIKGMVSYVTQATLSESEILMRERRRRKWVESRNKRGITLSPPPLPRLLGHFLTRELGASVV